MNQLIRIKNVCFTVFILLLQSSFVFAQQEEKELYEGQFAPAFSVKDIDGKYHSIEKYKGQKILLTFYRNAADPVSNFRFQELESQQDYFKQKNLVLIAVYESSIENVKLLRDTNQYFQIMIADPDAVLYKAYGVEESKGKMTKGKLHGLASKSKEGKNKLPQKMKQDGKPNRIGAEFLMDENGNIITGYYGKYLGDNLPMEIIRNKIN